MIDLLRSLPKGEQMSERNRLTIYVNRNVYFFTLLLAILSVGLSDRARAAEDASVHPT